MNRRTRKTLHKFAKMESDNWIYWSGDYGNRNIIDAIGTLIKRIPLHLDDPYSRENPFFSARYLSIEDYVINLFADSFGLSEEEKITRWGEVFSHIGNTTNPPDFMLRGGDAIEIKNIHAPQRAPKGYNYDPLILNTVYPRQKLFFDDPLVTNECRRAERWKEKDVIYAVGVSQGKQLTHFCMIYGVDYCASAETYEKILAGIRTRLKDIPKISFSGERTLGRVNAVDPTGVTYLEPRNMWYIENPCSFFRDVYRPNPRASFNFMCIINREKFYRLDNVRKLFDWAKVCDGLRLAKVRIKNPDAPDTFRDALLIRYEI